MTVLATEPHVRDAANEFVESRNLDGECGAIAYLAFIMGHALKTEAVEVGNIVDILKQLGFSCIPVRSMRFGIIATKLYDPRSIKLRHTVQISQYEGDYMCLTVTEWRGADFIYLARRLMLPRSVVPIMIDGLKNHFGDATAA